jgi:hypothetical protein
MQPAVSPAQEELMKILIPIGAALMAAVVSVSAQDSTVQSRTEIKADDAKVTVMKGCLTRDAAGAFSLKGTIASGDEITTTAKTTTEADRDDVSVKSETRTRVDGGAVGTSGTIGTYVVVPRSGVDLMTHIGKSVEVSAVRVEAGRGDAEVSISEKTTVERENKSDASARTKTEVELPRSSAGAYTVMSIKPATGADGC